LPSIKDFLQSVRPWIEQLAQALQSIDVGWFSVGLAAAVLLAALSRNIACLVGACLLSAVALISLVAPSSASSGMAVAAGVGAVLVALTGIAITRRDAAIQGYLAGLESRVANLEAAEERRMVTELKSSTQEPTYGRAKHSEKGNSTPPQPAAS
jgi:hypothetical protein